MTLTEKRHKDSILYKLSIDTVIKSIDLLQNVTWDEIFESVIFQ